MKLCGKCNEYLDSALFSKNKRYSDGLWVYCKNCDSKRVAEYRAKNPEKVKESSRKSKEKHADRVAATKRRYRENNPEKVKAARKLAYDKNRVSELEKSKEYKIRNKEELARKSSERLKESPFLNRFYRSERRAFEKRAVPSWSSKEMVKKLHAKAVELKRETGIDWHVDHIVPLKSKLVCGLHWHGNMQLLPASVNQSKSNRLWPDMP